MDYHSKFYFTVVPIIILEQYHGSLDESKMGALPGLRILHKAMLKQTKGRQIKYHLYN